MSRKCGSSKSIVNTSERRGYEAYKKRQEKREMKGCLAVRDRTNVNEKPPPYHQQGGGGGLRTCRRERGKQNPKSQTVRCYMISNKVTQIAPGSERRGVGRTKKKEHKKTIVLCHKILARLPRSARH